APAPVRANGPGLAGPAHPARPHLGAGLPRGPAGRDPGAVRRLPGAAAALRPSAAAVAPRAALPPGALAVRPRAVRPVPRPRTLGDRMAEPHTRVAHRPSPAQTRARRARRRWRQHFFATGPVEVTVCIANWNCRDLLRACLESLHDRPQGVWL